jgi:carbamoyl-phosphate synthase small subunit
VLLSLKAANPPAILALADGTIYIGHSIGATGSTVGEVVFNTAMTGYQEILTDPSYCQQIVTLTYPHIGNYGVNPEDVESEKVHAAGLIIKDLPLVASNFRQSMTLQAYLVREGTVAIANIDTRQLTRQLRTQGAQNGCIVGLAAGETITQAVIDKAIAAAKAAPSMSGLDLAKVVTVKASYPWTANRVGLVQPRTGRQARLWHAGSSPVPCGGLRLWCQKEYFAHAVFKGLPRDGGACPNVGGRRAQAQAERHLPVQRPG